MSGDLTLLVTWENADGWQEERWHIDDWQGSWFWTKMEFRRFVMIHLVEDGDDLMPVLVWQDPIDYPND